MGREGAGEDGPGTPVVVDVTFDTVTGWRRVPMPSSNGPAEIRVLRRFGAGAMSALVRFPAGWSRPVAGFYAAAELFVVLDGVLLLGDLRLRSGTGAFIPAHTPRWRTEAPHGSLAWAHFDGPADFVARQMEAPEPEHLPGGLAVTSFSLADAASGSGREVLVEANGWVSWLTGGWGSPEPGPVEVVAPTERRWVYASAGTAVPALRGPVLVRRPTPRGGTA